MKYAMIFPGQGAQRPGMGKDIYDRYASAKRVFDEADDALGFSLSSIIFGGTPEELAHTEITQPAILTVSVAMYRALEQEIGTALEPECMAGHSLGEYTALVASGSISLADGVRLVHKRGALMQEAVPIGMGSMAAIIGLELSDVSAICAEAAQGEVCQAANINSPTQIVISGHTGAINRAMALVEQKYTAKIVPLRVSAPFHCALMRPVAEELKEAFKSVEWHVPKMPIIANANARHVQKIPAIREALYDQTFSPVMWSQSVLEMQNDGIEGYIELGPGSVLSGLIRKICKGRRPYAVSNSDELLAAAKYLKEEA
ncbi:MAG: ACP S-malonyltransferase [Cloacibacillus sp.]